MEIVGLKGQNRNLVDATLKKEEERKELEYKYKELLDKIDKLVKQIDWTIANTRTKTPHMGYDYC